MGAMEECCERRMVWFALVGIEWIAWGVHDE